MRLIFVLCCMLLMFACGPAMAQTACVDGVCKVPLKVADCDDCDGDTCKVPPEHAGPCFVKARVEEPYRVLKNKPVRKVVNRS